ncbi:hypothetical protein FQR65_LT00576 [Abscondita terminalis]|nr:hypothetical protein FQR65_LT00576 [Abscondita terminalis]
MKVLVVLSSLLIVAYGLAPEVLEAIKNHAIEVGGKCKAEIGASDDDIAPIKHHSLPTTEKGKCFLACMHKKGGFQTEDGKINKDSALHAIEKLKNMDAEYYEKVKQVIETCMDKVHDTDNECDTAMSMYECALAEKEKVGLPKIDFD